MKQATDYTTALAAVTTYAVVSDTLRLSGSDGTEALVFNAQAQGLAGTKWSATAYNNGKEAVVSLAPDTRIDMAFDSEGKIGGFAGCNNYTAPYEASAGAIAIGPPASQKMACPDPAMSQETQYLAVLPTAVTYTVEADRLELRAADGALVATYRSEPSE